MAVRPGHKRLTAALWMATLALTACLRVTLQANAADAVETETRGRIDWSLVHSIGIVGLHHEEIPATGGRYTAVDPDDDASQALATELRRRGVDVSIVDLTAFQRAERESGRRTSRSVGVLVDGSAVDTDTIQDGVVLCLVPFGPTPSLMPGLLKRLHVDAVLVASEFAYVQRPSLLSKVRFSEVRTHATLNTCDGRPSWWAEAHLRADGPDGYRLLPNGVPSISTLRAATTSRVVDLMQVPPPRP